LILSSCHPSGFKSATMTFLAKFKTAAASSLVFLAFCLVTGSSVSCSLLSKIGIGSGSESPRAISKELPAASRETATALELATLLHSTAEDRRTLTDPVSQKFPDNASRERSTIQQNWSNASRLYGESMERLSNLNSTSVAQSIQNQKKMVEGSTTKTQILEIISVHQNRLRGGHRLSATEWEQDFRTMFYRKPAQKDPAAERSTRIFLGE